MLTSLTRTAVVVATAAAPLTLAAPAHADQYDFVSYLDNKGVYYSSISGVIDAGKMSCRLLRADAGVPSAMGFLGRQGFTSREAAIIIVAAVDDMCPDTLPALRAFVNEPSDDGDRLV